MRKLIVHFNDVLTLYVHIHAISMQPFDKRIEPLVVSLKRSYKLLWTYQELYNKTPVARALMLKEVYM